MDDNSKNNSNNELNNLNNINNANQRGRRTTQKSQVNQPRRYNPLNPSNMPQNFDEVPLPPKNELVKEPGIAEKPPIESIDDTNKELIPEENNDEIIYDDNEVEPIEQPTSPQKSRRNSNLGNLPDNSLLRSNPLLNKLNRFNQRNKQNQPENEVNNNPNEQKSNNNNQNKENQNESSNANNQNNKKTANDKENNQQNTQRITNSVSQTSTTSSKISSGLNKAHQIANMAHQLNEAETAGEIKEAVKEEVKQKVKQKVKEKVVASIMQVIIPLLPYVLIIFLIIVVIFTILYASLSYYNDEDRVIKDMVLNYCEQVNLKWEEVIQEEVIQNGVVVVPKEVVEKDVTISANEYIAYEISSSDFNIIDNDEALKALVIAYRTNLYNNSDNMDSNTCHFEIESEYEEPTNEQILSAVADTKNKVFSEDPDDLNTLDIDDYFSYTQIDDNKYVVYQDLMHYDKNWVDEHVFEDKIQKNVPPKRSFTPFGAWYLAEVSHKKYHELLYHYISPTNPKANIYNAVKIGGSMYADGTYCSDIPLSQTSLSRQEFIDLVNNNVSSSVFKANAGKIYDISIKNNFNPEMVVIRASLEGGFTEQGGKNNYWGIACFNGSSKCKEYSSFDEGVLAYINNIKGHNYTSAYNMMLSYAYIGDYWFNPGGSGLGGCYYFEHIKTYLPEDRISEISDACQSTKSCQKGGIGDCLKTTDADQQAYAKWQVSKMTAERERIFGIPAEECPEPGEGTEETGDLNSLGARVARYAVATFDSFSYSQELRMSSTHVDCSSMVARSYAHFQYAFNGNETTDSLLRWCDSHGKTIGGSNLQPGDLIFFNSNGYENTAHYKNVGHVSMYIGNGQHFAAHGQWMWQNGKKVKRPQDRQVSYGPYGNNGNLFCRPTK